jgi:hypothetical protein
MKTEVGVRGFLFFLLFSPVQARERPELRRQRRQEHGTPMLYSVFCNICAR